MEINITIECIDGTSLRASAMSFGRAYEELAALERKYDKLTKTDDLPL